MAAGSEDDWARLVGAGVDSAEAVRVALRFWEAAMIAMKSRVDALEARVSELEAERAAVAVSPGHW